jgi:hypothetical protein
VDAFFPLRIITIYCLHDQDSISIMEREKYAVYFDGSNTTTNRILDVLVIDSDNGEIGIDDNGDPNVGFHSTDYESIKRAQEICKFGIER